MKIAVIVFPGSNCDIDIYEALHTVCGADVDYVSHKQESLAGYDAVMLPGGFSYGDYLRAGAITRFSPVMGAVVEMARAGKPVFGTCNGFQILTEAGLLPARRYRWRWFPTGPSLPASTKSTNGLPYQLLTQTVATMPTRRPLTSSRRTTRSSSVMPKKTRMAVCGTSLEFATSGATCSA